MGTKMYFDVLKVSVWTETVPAFDLVIRLYLLVCVCELDAELV